MTWNQQNVMYNIDQIPLIELSYCFNHIENTLWKCVFFHYVMLISTISHTYLISTFGIIPVWKTFSLALSNANPCSNLKH